MTAEDEAAPTTPAISTEVVRAIDMAVAGTASETEPVEIVAARKEYSSRGGRRAHWYKMVWRGNSWRYFAEDREPQGTFLASERKWTGRGAVYAGEVLCAHDRGGKVDTVQLVLGVGGESLIDLEFVRTRSGMLHITFPGGRTLDLPDPRP